MKKKNLNAETKTRTNNRNTRLYCFNRLYVEVFHLKTQHVSNIYLYACRACELAILSVFIITCTHPNQQLIYINSRFFALNWRCCVSSTFRCFLWEEEFHNKNYQLILLFFSKIQSWKIWNESNCSFFFNFEYDW